MTLTLDDVFAAAVDGSLKALTTERADEVTDDLAREARAACIDALHAGNLGLAHVAAISASMLWIHLGDREQSLVSYVDWQQIEYMRAETPAEYDAARQSLRRATEMAEEVGSRDEAFKAAAIAADCSFWAALGAEGAAEKQRRLVQTLRDVIDVAPLADPAVAVSFERYVSLLAATASEAMSTIWSASHEAEAADLLRELASVADAVVPIDFRYEQAGDAEKTAGTASILAELLDAHGG